MRADTLYHFARALEGSPPCDGAAAYALSVRHVLNGYIPTERFLAAGRRASASCLPEGAIERRVIEWMRTSVNPLSQLVRNIPSRSMGAWALHEFHRNADLNTTNIVLPASDAADAPWAMTRIPRLPGGEPPACTIAGLCSLRVMGNRIENNQRTRAAGTFTRLSEHARVMGAEQAAAAQVAEALEAEPWLSGAALAHALGCSRRTLQRQLFGEGVTAAALIAAVRLLRATEQVLWTERSLGQVATDERFSDLAHMGRAFRISCGVSPGVLRRISLRIRLEHPHAWRCQDSADGLRSTLDATARVPPRRAQPACVQGGYEGAASQLQLRTAQ